MYKFVVLCALIVCSQTAPTEEPAERNSTTSSLQQKSVRFDHQTASLLTEKREKREDLPAPLASASSDDKRTPALTQPGYQENKPPTFIHPVPVDQIIKNSNVSPQIHSNKPVEEEVEETKSNVEKDDKATNEDENADQQQQKHKHAYSKPAIKTNAKSESDDIN